MSTESDRQISVVSADNADWALAINDAEEAAQYEAARQDDIDEAITEKYEAQQVLDMIEDFGATKARVIVALCRIKDIAHQHLLMEGGKHAKIISDCFCMADGQPLEDGTFKEDGKVLAFLLAAVDEKIANDQAKTLAARTQRERIQTVYAQRRALAQELERERMERSAAEHKLGVLLSKGIK